MSFDLPFGNRTPFVPLLFPGEGPFLEIGVSMAIDVRMAVVTGVACKKMRAQHAAMPAREEFTSARILNQRVRVCQVIGTDDPMIQTLTSAEKFPTSDSLARGLQKGRRITSIAEDSE